jgi:hypothetical protein
MFRAHDEIPVKDRGDFLLVGFRQRDTDWQRVHGSIRSQCRRNEETAKRELRLGSVGVSHLGRAGRRNVVSSLADAIACMDEEERNGKRYKKWLSVIAGNPNSLDNHDLPFGVRRRMALLCEIQVLTVELGGVASFGLHTSYFNPTPNDRNVEFDTKRNLIPDGNVSRP